MTFSVAAGSSTSQARNMASLRSMSSPPEKSGDGAGLFAVLAERLDIEAVGIVDRAIVLDDADDLEALRGHQPRRHAADIAESLDDDAASTPGPDRTARSALSVTIMQPRPVASGRPREPPSCHGLAGDHRGDGVARVHGVGVHDPGHDAGRWCSRRARERRARVRESR